MTEPAGSKAPITMATELGKWTAGIDAHGLKMLDCLATDINKTIENTQKSVCRAQIKVGKLLLEAREHFAEDQAFGKWRTDSTHIKSKQSAHDLMKVARDFENAPQMVEACSHSVLVELVTAPPSYKAEVIKTVEQGDKPPTVKEVREAKKGPDVRTPPKSNGSAPVAVIPPPVRTQQDQSVVALGWRRRADLVREMAANGRNRAEWSYILFGLDPDPQCPINETTLRYIYDGYHLGATEPDQELLTEAYEHIQYDINNFDE